MAADFRERKGSAVCRLFDIPLFPFGIQVPFYEKSSCFELSPVSICGFIASGYGFWAADWCTLLIAQRFSSKLLWVLEWSEYILKAL